MSTSLLARSVLLLVGILGTASAIYEDQLGEADWKIENIGVIQHAIHQDKRIVVSSVQGVLALLQQNSGKPLWRDVLPRGDRIDHIAATDKQIIGLCNGGSLLRSWSLSTGDLQWEVSLTKVSDGTLALRSAALELALDPASGLVVALQDNCVNYISMTTGEIGWFWCPSDDAVILSHLVGPFTPAAKPIRRTAVACRVEAPEGYSGDAALLPCTTLSVLTVSLPVRPGMDKHAMEVWELPDVDLAGTAVRAADLRSAFAATSFDSVAAAAKLNGEDVIFAAMSDEERDVIHAVSLRARVAAEWVFAASSPAVVTAWSVVWTDTSAPRPVVSFCRSGGHNQCDLYALGIGGTAPTKVVSCGPADAPDGYIAGTAVVATGRQATHPWNQMWTVGCSVVMHAKSSGTAAQVVSKAVNASGAVVTAVADIPSDKHGQPVAASLQASHLQLFSTKADAKQSVRSLFVGAGVGSVFFTQGSRAVWNREEGLSQIRQVLMIPRPQGGDEETAKGDAEVSSKALLSFSARLKMQYADLLKTLENVSRWGSLHGRLAVLHILDASSRRAALYRMTKSIGLPLSFLAPSDVSAEKGGNSYLHALEKAAEREARDGVGKQFGFDKVAVVLSYASGSDSGGDSAVEDARVVSAASFLEDAALRRMGAKVMALDLIHGDTVWSTELNLESVASHVAARRLAAGAQGGDADRVQILVKLLPGSTHRDESSAAGLAEGVGASLVAVSVRYLPPNGAASAADDVLTCVWHIDVHSGAIYNSVDSPRNGQPSMCLPVGPGAVVGATLVDRSAAAQLMHTVEEATELAASDRVIGGVFTHLLLRHDDKTVSAYPPAKACVTASAEGVTQYVHAFESEQGALVTYKLQREGRVVHAQGCPAANRDDIICPEYVTYSLGAVGSVLTGTTVGNRVVAVAYPTPHDKVTSRAYVLGDKSLLLKYLNPNLVVVVTECFESQLSSAENIVEVGEENAGVSHLVVSALDTVTGRVIYRYEIAHGGPVSPALDRGHSVHAEIVEHAIVVTYWNYKAQRTELSSLMLYEGMVPKNGLGPMTSFKSPAHIDVSSFSAPQPIGLQKTFVLPKAVVSLDHTVTLKGLTNKHLLVGLKNGQVYRLDMRQVDPRRPLTAPTQAEKEEGLMQYNPFLPLIPQNAVTNNGTVARLTGLASSPSMALESASLVMVFGLDVFFTRVSPSKGFDMLSSEFNRSLLTLILGVVLVIVLVLRKMHKNKLINAAWK